MYRYVIFDVDGTMIDTEEAVFYAYQTLIFKKYGRYFTDEEMLKGYGVPTPKSLERYGFTDIKATLEEYYRYLEEGFSRSRTFPGIAETIDRLAAMDIPLGVVTSRSDYELEIDPSLQKFLHRFASVVCSNDTVKHKPEAEPLLAAMKKMNADPAATLYIGDTVFDRMCAKNAGVKFALALWGTNNAENIDADYFLKNPADLFEIL